MNTPVCDFVKRYTAAAPVRMHMPGHKGQAAFGPEAFDITEIEGADELYPARGIIRESEANAAVLFGAGRTLYSAEGSSLCIRAMLYLAALTAGGKGVPQRLLAGRNAHKTLMTAAALLDLEIDWLLPGKGGDLLGCAVTAEALEDKLKGQPYMAVWLTSPDYLGRRADLRAAAEVCRRYGVPLLVDNAHGAYLRFLEPDAHPLTLGADACCDSAHKTLSCLTGAAYLHIAPGAPEGWAEQAEQAMALFASTSPSWLILQSLDRMNPELAGGYPARLREAARRTAETKKILLYRQRAGAALAAGRDRMRVCRPGIPGPDAFGGNDGSGVRAGRGRAAADPAAGRGCGLRAAAAHTGAGDADPGGHAVPVPGGAGGRGHRAGDGGRVRRVPPGSADGDRRRADHGGRRCLLAVLRV